MYASEEIILLNKTAINLEDALTATGFGRYNYFLILIGGFNLSALLTETLSISFIIPVLDCDYELTRYHKTVLNASGLAGLLFSIIWGTISDMKGRRAVLLPTFILTIIFSLCSNVTRNFWLFVAFRYLNGACVSSSAIIYVYLSEFHSSHYREKAIIISVAISAIIMSTITAIAFEIINQSWILHIPILNLDYKPWRLFILICALPGILSAVGLFLAQESPKYILSQGDQVRTGAILNKVYKINKGKTSIARSWDGIYDISESALSFSLQVNETPQSNKKIQVLINQIYSVLRRKYIAKTTIACTLLFVSNAVAIGFFMWLPDVSNNITKFSNAFPMESAKVCEILHFSYENFTENIKKNVSTNETSICSANLEVETRWPNIILNIVYIVGSFFIAFIIKKCGKFTILLVTFVSCGLLGITSTFITHPIVALYCIVCSITIGLVIAVVKAISVDIFPVHLRGTILGLATVVGNFGSIFGTHFIGSMLDYNCNLAFIGPSIFMIFCGIIGFFIPNIAKVNR